LLKLLKKIEVAEFNVRFENVICKHPVSRSKHSAQTQFAFKVNTQGVLIAETLDGAKNQGGVPFEASTSEFSLEMISERAFNDANLATSDRERLGATQQFAATDGL